MATIDVNTHFRVYLAAQAGLTALVGTRIYCPRIPEGAALPALAFFVRGGHKIQSVPTVFPPSFQVDCWGSTLIAAREVYGALCDCLEAHWAFPVPGHSEYILSAYEEGFGQDMPEEYVGYWRVLSFWSVTFR